MPDRRGILSGIMLFLFKNQPPIAALITSFLFIIISPLKKYKEWVNYIERRNKSQHDTEINFVFQSFNIGKIKGIDSRVNMTAS